MADTRCTSAVRPDVGRQDFLDVVESADVRIVQDLGNIIVDQAVRQRIEVGKRGAENKEPDQ